MAENRLVIAGNTPAMLAPCPDSPNCVQSVDASHKSYITPMELRGNKGSSEYWEILRMNVLSMPRTRLVEQRDNYIRVEFRSMLFRFVDDVEFLFDKPHNIVHMRSASRTGRYDFGVNRKRLEAIRMLYEKEAL